jgi:hypothetical protein
VDKDQTQFPDNAAIEPDFAEIARRRAPPRRRKGWALYCIAGLAALGILAFLFLDLQEERRVDQAMQIVAVDAPAPPVAAAPPPSTLPPLVMLDAEEAPKAAAKPAPAARKPLASPAQKARPTAPRPLRRDLRLAAQSSKASPARPQKSLTTALAQRCKPRDRARECMAMLCREGKKGDPACQALSLLDQ